MLTVCLLNWKRPENLARIITALKDQSLKPTLFLWNNGPAKPYAVDWQVDSRSNAACSGRWLMASQAQTDWVCTHDDDFLLSDPECLAKALEAAEKTAKGTICGLEGVRLNGTTYSLGKHYRAEAQQTQVDVVKGRLMLMRRSDLAAVPLASIPKFVDDIYISSKLKGKHLVLPCFKGALNELPAPHSICSRPTHWPERDQAVRSYFGLR